VVNGSPLVSAGVRAAVEAAIEEMGYSPNRAARSLAAHRSETVSLVVSEPSVRLFADPFFAGTALGITRVLGSTRYQLVLLMMHGEADRVRVERHLLRGGADGALLLSSRADDPLPGRLAEAGIPCVLAGRPPVGVAVGFVDADNVGGAEQAVTHLVRRGRQVIATVCGPPTWCRAPTAGRAGRTRWSTPAGRRMRRWWPRATSPGPAARPPPGPCSRAVPTSTRCSWRRT
jgi:DNA-binding LacI/PurR family transcriptional regulator